MFHRELLLLVVLLTVNLTLSTNFANDLDDFDERSPKKSEFIYSDTQKIVRLYKLLVWPKIGLVRFAQDLCTTYEGYYGTCVTRRQCEHISGIQSGSCTTNGLGRCCMSMIATEM